jgi:cobalamin biosynthesis Mg chelatase CobN
MFGSRHPRGRSSARPAFALLSVLAVLAMALFPGLAQAEESSGIQYESDVPTVPHHESSNIPSAKPPGGSNNGGSGPGATSSNSPNGGGTGSNGNSSTGGGAHSGQTSQGSTGGNDSGNGGAKPAGGNVGESQKVVNAGQPVNETSEGSSSPLVPILIAIVVLAAISIGAFYYRQRRQDPDSSVSPKAS